MSKLCPPMSRICAQFHTRTCSLLGRLKKMCSILNSICICLKLFMYLWLPQCVMHAESKITVKNSKNFNQNTSEGHVKIRFEHRWFLLSCTCTVLSRKIIFTQGYPKDEYRVAIPLSKQFVTPCDQIKKISSLHIKRTFIKKLFQLLSEIIIALPFHKRHQFVMSVSSKFIPNSVT